MSPELTGHEYPKQYFSVSQGIIPLGKLCSGQLSVEVHKLEEPSCWLIIDVYSSAQWPENLSPIALAVPPRSAQCGTDLPHCRTGRPGAGVGAVGLPGGGCRRRRRRRREVAERRCQQLRVQPAGGQHGGRQVPAGQEFRAAASLGTPSAVEQGVYSWTINNMCRICCVCDVCIGVCLYIVRGNRKPWHHTPSRLHKLGPAKTIHLPQELSCIISSIQNMLLFQGGGRGRGQANAAVMFPQRPL